MMASKALPQLLLRRSRCLKLSSACNNIIGSGAHRHLSSNASNLAITESHENVVACPPNLKFGPRTASSPFFGLDRIDQSYDAEEDVEVDEGEDEDDDITLKLQQLELYDLDTKPDTTYHAIPLPDRLTVPIWNINEAGEDMGELKLNADVFGLSPIRIDLIHRVGKMHACIILTYCFDTSWLCIATLPISSIL